MASQNELQSMLNAPIVQLHLLESAGRGCDVRPPHPTIHRCQA